MAQTVNRAAFDCLFGNENLKKTLYGFTENRSFPNSLIISGAEGSGKHLIAKLIALSIACRSENHPCLECEACRKISEGISPDVVLIDGGGKKSIGVEAVRLIKDGAYIKPNDLDCRIYIISDADTMTVQAQNALLKLFEEPPENVYFILLAAEASGLLATVCSRAPELKTEVFTAEVLADLLVSHTSGAKQIKNSDPELFERILRLAGGSYGKAVSLAEGRGKDTEGPFEAVEAMISSLSSNDGAELLLQLISAASSREKFQDTLYMMTLAVRDLIAVKRTRDGVPLLFYRSIGSAKTSGAGFTAKKLVSALDVLVSAGIDISDTNINLLTAATVTAKRLREC